MLIVFPSIFVTDTKKIYSYNFVDPLKRALYFFVASNRPWKLIKTLKKIGFED